MEIIRYYLKLYIAIVLCLSAPAITDAAENANKPPLLTTTLGVRAGDGTVEGFLDILGPIHTFKNGVIFLNPRVGLQDGGEHEFNAGIGYRHLIPDYDLVLGANLYLDSRKTGYGNRFNQLGAGMEILSEWVDFRANYYYPEDDEELIRSYQTEETRIRTQTSVNTTTQTSTTDASSSIVAGAPYSSGNSIWQDYITTTNYHITTRKTTTIRTDTETTTIRHLFEQFEAALQGYDLELGVKLPVPEELPEVRLFGGRYAFDNPYGSDLNGWKGRLEVRAGSYLTFDAEVYENDELNGSDYFIGARLQIPFDIFNPVEALKKVFTPKKRRTARDRMYADMVMRDVRVQTEESDFLENQAQKTTAIDTRTDISSSTSVTETTRTATERDTRKVASGTMTTDGDSAVDPSDPDDPSDPSDPSDPPDPLEGITFVDGDNTTGVEDGTPENPYNTIQEGVDNAGPGNTIFVDDAILDYLENILLSDYQTLTSTMILPDGSTYASLLPPDLDGGAGDAITLADGNTIERINITGGARGIVGSGISGTTRIKNVVIKNTVSHSIDIQSSAGVVTIAQTKIDKSGGDGIHVDSFVGDFTIADTGINNSGNFGADIRNSTGNFTVSDTVIHTTVDSAVNILNHDGSFTMNGGDIQDSGNYGILIKDSAGDYTLKNVTINQILRDGIACQNSIHDSETYLIVQGCTVIDDDAGSGGIFLEGKNNAVICAHISDSVFSIANTLPAIDIQAYNTAKVGNVILNNVINGSNSFSIKAQTFNIGSQICLHATGNSDGLGSAPVGNFFLDNSVGGSLGITQNSDTDLSSDNNNGKF